MKKIAIKPHKTRGKEVISILEKNGGVNCNEYSGTEHIEHPVAYYVAVDHYIVFSNITFLEQRGYKIYTLEEWEDECKSDEMIEGLVEEETKPKYEEEKNGEYYSTPKYLVRPSGYQFVDENGNVINATKIVLEKKKKEYPKTYEECYCVLLERASVRNMFGYKADLMVALQKLLVCRDAYWKIAGEEMGLGKPWKPDWNNISDKYCIYFVSGYAWSKECQTRQCPFAFPTPEMRDAFKENFDPDIEICKELL